MRVPVSGAAATSTRRSPPVARARPRVDARAVVGAGVHPGTRGCVGGARKNPRVVRWAPIVRPNDARVRRAEDLGRGRLSRVAARAGETDARSSPDDPSDDPFPDARSEGAGQTRSTDREDAIGTLGTDPMYADEWTAGGYSSDARDVVDARRRRDRDRMLYMSPIRAKDDPRRDGRL